MTFLVRTSLGTAYIFNVFKIFILTRNAIRWCVSIVTELSDENFLYCSCIVCRDVKNVEDTITHLFIKFNESITRSMFQNGIELSVFLAAILFNIDFHNRL